jgi:hypothetical protein
MSDQRIHILPHINMGDLIICRGIVKHYAARYKEVVLLCFDRYLESTKWLYKDLNCSFYPVMEYSFDWAKEYAGQLEGKDERVLCLGMMKSDFFEMKDLHFDERFYIQAHVPFEERWCGFHGGKTRLEQHLYDEFVKYKKYAFVHDDEYRGMIIDTRNIEIPVVRARHATDNIFDWQAVIKGASEIHCIDSAFLCLIESLPEDGVPLYWHLYARRNEEMMYHPRVRRPWTILEKPL